MGGWVTAHAVLDTGNFGYTMADEVPVPTRTQPQARAYARAQACDHRPAQAFLVRLGLYDGLRTYPRVSVLGVVPGKTEAMPVVEVSGPLTPKAASICANLLPRIYHLSISLSCAGPGARAQRVVPATGAALPTAASTPTPTRTATVGRHPYVHT